MARPAHGWTNALPDVRRATEAVLAKGRFRRGSCWLGGSRATSWTGAACRSSGPPELLRQVLDDIELDRECVYLTNAVKHFEWRAKGKRGIHDTPSWSEVRACDVWLRAELALLRPTVLVCLGRTAARRSCGVTPAWASSAASARRAPISRCRSSSRCNPSAVLQADAARAERRLGLAHDLRLACATAGKDVSRRRKVGSRRSHTQTSSKGA